MARFRPHRMYPGALLAQECCSYQASTELLAQLRGEIVVLVHSDRDCSNVISKRRGRVHAEGEYKFLCTNLREDEMVTGQGNSRLRAAIELVHEQLRPKLILVLSTCPTVMIGDNIKNVARKAGRDLGVSVVPMITHGLKPKSPAEVVDDVYCALTAPSVPAEGDRSRRINLVGMTLRPDERAEMTRIFAAMGVEVGVVLDERAALDDFLAIGQAGWNVHPGPNMLLAFDKACAERQGIEPIEVPLPYGVGASIAFYHRVAAALGIADDVRDAALAAPAARAEAAIAAFRAANAERPLQLAYNIGSVRSFDLRRIALEELGELPLFHELGFAARLFIQGSQDEANWDRVARVLGELGVQERFVLFPDPGTLVHFVQPGAFDLWYGARFLRDQLVQVQLPLLPHHEFGLGLEAVAANVARVETALRSDFYARFQAEITTSGSVEQLDAMLGLGKGVPIPPTQKSPSDAAPTQLPVEALSLRKRTKIDLDAEGPP